MTLDALNANLSHIDKKIDAELLNAMLSHNAQRIVEKVSVEFNVDIETAEELFRETIKFLWIFVKYPQDCGQKYHVGGAGISILDDVWHIFILHTKEYSDFCEQFFGQYLHHWPSNQQESKLLGEHFEQIQLTQLEYICDTLGPETGDLWFNQYPTKFNTYISHKHVSIKEKQLPGVKIPPPLLLLAFVVLSLGVNALLPLMVADGSWVKFAGKFAVIADLLIIYYIHKIFLKNQTNLSPLLPTQNIITSGIFSISRNPVYLCFVLMLVALGCAFNNLWLVLASVCYLLLIQKMAIEPEEAYLENRFGKPYLDYKNTVRRWL